MGRERHRRWSGDEEKSDGTEHHLDHMWDEWNGKPAKGWQSVKWKYMLFWEIAETWMPRGIKGSRGMDKVSFKVPSGSGQWKEGE